MGQLTNNLLRDYHNKIGELKDYEFSLHNIYELKIDINRKIFEGIEDTIVVFAGNSIGVEDGKN